MSLQATPRLSPTDATRLARVISGGAVDKSFEKLFADRFARYLRENFASPVRVAAAFRVRERTAENWWNGLNRPNGEVVNEVWLRDPEGARRWLGVPA